EVGMLVNGVMPAEESSRPDVDALLLGDFVELDQTWRVTGSRRGDRRVEGMREAVAQCDARRPGLNLKFRNPSFRRTICGGGSLRSHLSGIVHRPHVDQSGKRSR